MGNSCEYELALEDQEIVGSCTEPHAEPGPGPLPPVYASTSNAIWLTATDDDGAMPYDRLDYVMTVADGRSWQTLDGFHWALSGDDPMFPAAGPKVVFYFSRDAEKSSGATSGPPKHLLEVWCTIGWGESEHDFSAFDFQLSSVREVCQREGDRFFLVHGSLDAACDVKRNGMPTTEQAVIHITF